MVRLRDSGKVGGADGDELGTEGGDVRVLKERGGRY